MDLSKQTTSFCLPSLHSLSVVDVDIPEQRFSSTNFPSLRHFAYDQSGGVLLEEAAATIVDMSPQLNSIVLVFDVVNELLKRNPSFPVQSVLVDYPSDTLWQMDEFVVLQTRRARIRVDVAFGDAEMGVTGVNGVSRVIENQLKCPQIESIYLPPLNLFGTQPQTASLRQAVDRLILVSQNRKIEIVHEEQPTGIKAETQLSAEFMRRMTKERIEREASNGM